MSPIFSLIGDSNVRRNITKTNSRACPQMSGSQVLFCQKLPLLEDALGKIRKESSVCIVACVTNFLTSSDDDSMVSKRVEPVLDEFVHHLTATCANAPDLTILVSPPMYRMAPVWYREGLPEVLTRFSGAFREKPANLHLLPSFPTPDYEADGVHLTAYSGLEYMIHLFDSSMSVLDMLSCDCEEHHPASAEATRLLEDRVVMLEQDHRRLNKDVELKAAIDAELHDFHENVSNEPFLMVTMDAQRRVHPMRVAIAVEFTTATPQESTAAFTPRIRDAALVYLRALTYENATNTERMEHMRTDLLRSFREAGAATAQRVLVTDLVVQ